MRRTKEEAEQTRQKLLDAALTVFSQKGYTATRLEDVARMAGVTRVRSTITSAARRNCTAR